jgi:hypothetical protein
MPIRIEAITSQAGQRLELGSFNVLVGPNNSGKSQTLRDIRDFVTTGSNSRLVVLQEIGLDIPAKEEALNGVRQLPHQSPGHQRMLGVSYDLQSQHEFAPHEDWLAQQYGSSQQEQLLQHLGRFWVAHLDAESRLRLANPTECYDTRTETPANAMQAFFAQRAEYQPLLRKAFREAFGKDVALDWAAMRRWYLRVSSDFGDLPDNRDELNVLMESAPDLAKQGDGFRSFAGVVLAMLTFPDRLLLLDEPEAFLHPVQARVLGRWFGAHSRIANAQVVLATHNADFLWGVISSNPDTRVIRLNRQADTTTFHVVAAQTTQELVRSPLLSSQPVLEALFQRGVVVCEGDPDRAVYQTVAHLVLATEGGEEVLFIHANGKDAIRGPVELLRAAGTPVCVIVDFDVVNSDEVLTGLLESLGADAAAVRELRRELAAVVEQEQEGDLIEVMKSAVQGWLETVPVDLRRARSSLRAIANATSKWSAVKNGGMAALPEAGVVPAEKILAICASTGLYIVPAGQLESWLPLGAAKGKRWNRLALETLHEGGCPDHLKSFVHDTLTYLQTAEIEASG